VTLSIAHIVTTAVELLEAIIGVYKAVSFVNVESYNKNVSR